jgi:hypothetical protein
VVEQAAFQTVFQFLQTVGILVGVFYYVMTIRANQRNQQLQLETRQAQLFMNIYNKWDEDMSNAFYEVMSWEWTDYDDFMEKYGMVTNRERYTATFSKLVGFHEGIGVLVKEGYLNIRLIALMVAGVTVRFWEKVEPVVLEGRVKENAPRWLSETEYLYNELMKYIEDHPELRT